MTILYIAGYGRSGSTILERVLAANNHMIACGELKYFPQLTLNSNLNSFWQIAFARIAKSTDLKSFHRIQFCFESFPAAFFSHLLPKRTITRYQKGIQEILSTLIELKAEELKQEKPKHERKKKQPTILIDSSKTAYDAAFRPIQLKRNGPQELKLVHLIRDVRGCALSAKKGSNRQIEENRKSHAHLALPKTAAGWVFSNLAAEINCLYIGRKNTVRIRYEDFCHAPHEVIQHLSSQLQIDLTQVLQMLNCNLPFPAVDQPMGNRNRTAPNLTILADEKWRMELPVWQQKILNLLCFPMLWFYGYRR